MIGSDFYNDKDIFLLSDEEIRKVNAFDWEKEFPQVFAGGGFEIVIGNPPYVRPENVDKIEREYYIISKKYEYVFGRFDLYILFIEQAIKLLIHKGVLSFIIPYSFYNQNYSKKMREWILKSYTIQKIIDLSDVKVFQTASVKNTIFVISNEEVKENQRIRVYKLKESKDISNMNYANIIQNVYLGFPQNMIRTDLNEKIINLTNKIVSKSMKFENICYVVIGAVPHDSKSGASKDRLISTIKENQSHKKYIEGKDMDRYMINDRGLYLNYQPKQMHRPKFPELFENKKIIVRNIVNKDGIKSTLDYDGFYTNDTLSICMPWKSLQMVNQRGTTTSDQQKKLSEIYSLELLTGLINSKLMNFYFIKVLSSNLHLYPEAIRNFPIFNINNDNDMLFSKIELLVKNMLTTQKQYHAANSEPEKNQLQKKIDLLDNQIDNLVYKLYGLTEEEIRIIEEG